MEDYNKYLKEWCDLYIHFCWHKSETPKQITDKIKITNKFYTIKFKISAIGIIKNNMEQYKFI